MASRNIATCSHAAALAATLFGVVLASAQCWGQELFGPDGPFRIQEQSEANDVVVNDRLLNRIGPDTDIYEILIQRGDQAWMADTSLAAKRSYVRYVDEAIYEASLERLLQQAAALRIPENGITEAILEGRLSPRLDDLYMAFCGVHTYTDSDCLRPSEARSRLITKCVLDAAASLPGPPDAWMLETGLITKLPSSHELGSKSEYYYFDQKGRYALNKSKITLAVVEYARKERLFYSNDSILNQNERRRQWSKRFGGLGDIESLETIHEGQLQQLSAADLAALTARRARESGRQLEYADPYWIPNPGIYDFLWFGKLPGGRPIGKDDPHPRHLDYYRIRNERYLPMLRQRAQEAVASKQSPELAATNAILSVQRILHEAGLTAPGFAVDGTWDDPDEVVVAEYIRSVQSIPDVWMGREVDGRWTPELSQAMRSLLAELDPSQAQVKTWQDFTDSMDFLLEAGIYRGIRQPPLVAGGNMPAVVTQNVPPSPTISSNDYWRACVLSWANGFAWEFGDEIIAKLIEHEDGDSARAAAFRSQVPDLMNRASDANAIILMVCAMIGYSVSFFGGAAIVVVGLQTERRPFKAFKLGAGIEILEEIVALIGEYSTMGSVNLKAAVFMGGAAAIVTGCMAAAAAGNKKRMQEEVGVSMGIVLLGCFLVWVTLIVNP